MKRLPVIYVGWAALVLGLYAWAGFSGWRMRDDPPQHIDPSVRSSPGGFRSHYFWHSGIFGGK